jgi:hypothetical protein
MCSARLASRIILLALLPGIAVILFLHGQHYDPSLIDFTKIPGEKASGPDASAQSAETSIPVLGAQVIAGLRQIGRAQRFTKDNLYEHVNGHAEYFISAGFVELTVTEYISSGSASAQADIHVEVFDMGKSIHAFGVLTDESGENARPVAVGTMAFRTSGGINFFKGRHYVKITAVNPKLPVLQFAQEFSSTLPMEQDAFGIFALLPAIGKTEKTRFIKEGYRGLDFLRNVIEREYTAGGKKITVALIDGSGQEGEKMRTAFFAYFDKSGMHYEKKERTGREFYRVIDRYEGNWFLIPSRNALFAVFGTEDEAVVEYFAKAKS